MEAIPSPEKLVWTLAFSDHVEFRPINDMYCELFSSGVQFPDINKNDVDVLKRTLPPGLPKASRSDQRPATLNTRTIQLMQAIRQDLDLTALDLPAFEALLQGLSCNPPDSLTIKQLQASAERLKGLQRRLEADIGSLSETMETNSESGQEEQATLDELIRVNEKIHDGIQHLQSYERMCGPEETRQTTALISGAQTTETAGTTVVTVASQPEAPKSSSAASSVATATPVASTGDAVGTRLAATTDVSRTLREAREGIQLFQTLQREMSASSAQMVDATTQIRELGIVAERLAGLQKRVHAHINGSISGNSAGNAEEDETTLANLTDVNDQLLHCLKNYQRTVQIDEVRMNFRLPLLNI
ncbi:unnamed protein product [Schistocephalus solidus]|uniref:HPt domain-containing protein n=1 Tax=Schistocephalus solidus TaxID=70667 RepID=A0A183TGA5_SCHSO|nr:unnamed protein product [Schistocephalus solidus]